MVKERRARATKGSTSRGSEATSNIRRYVRMLGAVYPIKSILIFRRTGEKTHTQVGTTNRM